MAVKNFLLNLCKMKVFILKKRKDFIRAAKEFKVVTNGLVLQAALSLSAVDENTCFAGYTATKKIGKAYLRNLTKRRLRAAVALVLPQKGLSGVNYVFVGRHNTATLDFAYLSRKLSKAVDEINQQITEARKSHDKKSDDLAD